MAEHGSSMRTVVNLSTGARVGAVVGALLLVLAAYLLWSPIQLYPVDGFPIKCGSAASPPGNDLGEAACGEANRIRQWQAGSAAVAAIVVALGSVYAFGLNRRRERLIGSERPEAPGGRTPSAE